MKENPKLMALAAAYAGYQGGTPAGNAGLTQEQLAAMRERGLRMEDVRLLPVLVRKLPACPGGIPVEHQAQGEMVEMQCPVMGCQLVAPGLSAPSLLLPNGQIGAGRP